MRIAIVAGRRSPADEQLVAVRARGLEVVRLSPAEAAGSLAQGDVALGRLDVRPGVDGVEDGLWSLGVLAARGATVLNGPGTLVAAHDKLLTARILRRAGLPHPETWHIRPGRPYDGPPAPLVLKPRHGSWGRHVTLCETNDAVRAELWRLRDEPWFRRHGVLVQELVPPTGSDLRLVVAGDRVVGAVTRVAREGEWRTNVALGATRVPLDPPAAAVELALGAACALGAALVGVDLLPTPDGGLTVLEVNGSVEFTHDYRVGRDIFRSVVLELARVALERAAKDRPSGAEPLLV
ncbi:MAG TPA: ATP-grasp domain-containing protein [Gaiella sp.]|jgi:RimK family alpha-L-glutamate ligase